MPCCGGDPYEDYIARKNFKKPSVRQRRKQAKEFEALLAIIRTKLPK